MRVESESVGTLPVYGAGSGGSIVLDGFEAPLSLAQGASIEVWDYSLRLPNDDKDFVAAEGPLRRRRAHHIHRSTG